MIFWLLIDLGVVILLARLVGGRGVPIPVSLLATGGGLAVLMLLPGNLYLLVALTVSVMGILFWRLGGVRLPRALLIGVLFILYKVGLVWALSLGFRETF
jgi:hypothetical protein